jgi:hypothetical protein
MPASPSQATQTFSHDTGLVRWEAEVTGETFALRETKQGASPGNEFVCPLGPAVRASVVRTGSEAGRICLVFSKDKCAPKSVARAPATPLSPPPGVATFKCLDFRTAGEASALAALINAGSEAHQAAARRTLAGSKNPVSAARPPGAAPPASAPPKASAVPARAAPAAPPASGGDAGRAPAKTLAGGHGL